MTLSECLTDNYTYRSLECSIHHMTTTPIPETLIPDLQTAEAKVEAAAAELVPVLTGTLADPVEIAKAVHDALNHLASARLRLGLAVEHLEGGPR